MDGLNWLIPRVSFTGLGFRKTIARDSHITMILLNPGFSLSPAAAGSTITTSTGLLRVL